MTELKDHFSRDATRDIESLFLISKSNCAFVNYRTEVACVAALHRFHDSRFQGVRLVCRLRRGSAPTAMLSVAGPSLSPAERSPERSQNTEASGTPEEFVALSPVIAKTVPAQLERVARKYFIVKSLTVQDLELSVQNGIWTTQSHNEDSLNRAYEVRLPFHSSPFECSQARGSPLTELADCGRCLPHLFRQQVGRVLWVRAHGVADPPR